MPSDRPNPPRVAEALEVVDLATIDSGEWDRVELVGSLPDGFDEPMLLTEVRVSGASFLGARIGGSRLVDVRMTSCDLAGIDLQDASLTRVEFIDTRLSGGQLSLARLRDVRLIECRVDGGNFAQAVGERVRFERCRMDSADFRNAQLAGVAWWDCDLTAAQFSQVRVSRAQLHGSTIADLHGAAALAPIGIDGDQFSAFAEHLLSAWGIVITDRDD